MEINQLFKKLQEDFITDESKGELVLQKKSIIWTYILDEDCEDIEISDCFDEEETYNQFESTSVDEILEEVSTEYIETIELFLDELNELQNWTFSDTKINDETISFKIF